MRIIVSERMLDAFKNVRAARARANIPSLNYWGNMTARQDAELRLAQIVFDAIESECIEVATVAGEQAP